MATPKTHPLVESPLSAGFWEKNKGRVAGVLALVAALVGLVLFIQHRGESTEAAGWNALLDPDQPLAIRQTTSPDTGVEGTTAEPWALYASARKAFLEKDLDLAERLVTQLQTEFANHPVNAGDAVPNLLSDIRAEKAWTASHSIPRSNPDPNADHTVTLTTALGDVSIGLFPEQAPEATRAFLNLIRQGNLGSGSFDEAQRESFILLSPPQTEVVAPESGAEQDDGKPTDLAQGKVTDRNRLSHYSGAISFRRSPIGLLGSNATPRVAIYLADNPRKDSEEIVFGMVTSGLDILKQASTRESIEGETKLKEPLAVTGVKESSGLAEIR